MCGYLTFRLGLSPIVGYLVAGFLVGPNTPGFVANQDLADQFAEVGVILLMFGVGLQFHIKELLAVRRVALPGALGQSLVATVLGTLAGVNHGWGWSSAIVFGLAVSVASTVVLMRVLGESGDLHTRAGHIAVGWLVVEDLFTVLVLVLLPAIFVTGNGRTSGVAIAIGLAAIKLAAMVGLTFVIGNRLVPWLLGCVAATHSRELFTLTILRLLSASRWGQPSSSGFRWLWVPFSRAWSSADRNSASEPQPRLFQCAMRSRCSSSSLSACSSIHVTLSNLLGS